MNRVIVKIAGVEYPIVGEEKKEYLEKLGTLVNREVEDIVKNSTGISLTMATTLAAINIADKLIKNGGTVVSDGENNIIKALEFNLQEKDLQIEALLEKLDMSEKENSKEGNDARVKEIMSISNEFQNKIFQLQEEIELLKKRLEKVDE